MAPNMKYIELYYFNFTIQPNSWYIFKEVLREKQNHIEHLLIERDLDRQDSENNAMMYQKTITQVCIRLTIFILKF